MMTDKRKAIEDKIYELAQLIGKAAVINNDVDLLTYNQVYTNVSDKPDGTIVVLRVTTRPYKSLEHYKQRCELMRPDLIEDKKIEFLKAKQLWEQRLDELNRYRSSGNWLPSGIKAREDVVFEAYDKMKKLKDKLGE